MRVFFGYSPKLRDDFEECLFAAKRTVRAALPEQWRSDDGVFDQALIDYFMNLPYDEAAEWQGAAPLALIHYFKRDNLAYPTAFVRGPDDVTCFVMSLYRVLLCPLERCSDIRHYRVSGAWTCPCATGTQCGMLSQSLQARLSVLQVAAQVAHINNRGSILNHAYACIDAHSKLLCAIHTRTVAANGDRVEVQRMCSDEVLGPLLAENPISLEWAFTLDSLPDTSPLLPLAMVYNSAANGASNKKIFQCKYPYMSADNIDRMEKLHKLIYKGLPTRCFNRQLWNAIRRCCVLYYPKLKMTKIDHEFVVFFFRIVVAAVLGVYRSAQKLDDINSRVQVYSAMHANIPIAAILDILTVGNKWTLLYITREYLREMIGRGSGVLEALRKTYNWDTNIAYIDQITAIMRAQIRSNLAALPRYAPMGQWASVAFRGVDIRIQALHNRSRCTQREKTIDYDVYSIVKTLRDMNLKKYEADMARQGEFLGREFLMKPPHPLLGPKEAGRARALEDAMRAVIRTFPKSHRVPLDWLVCFGAKWTDIIAIRAVLFRKMARLTSILSAMRVADPPSYAIFYNFFRLCKEHQDYREYYCDAYMYLRHAQTLHRAHRVPVNGHIPRVLGKLYVCPSCNDFKRMSFFRPTKRNKSTGGTGICRIAGDGRVVCGRKHKAASWRELLRAAAPSAPAAAGADPEEENVAAMERFAQFFNGQVDDNFDPLMDIKMDVLADEDDEGDGDFLPEAKGNVKVPSERVRRRKFARHVALQHTLNECHDRELHVINVLGRIAVYQRSALVACMRCLRPVPLLQAIDSGLDKICGECHQKERISMPAPRARCEAFQCIHKTMQPSEAYSVWAYDDTDKNAAKHGYRQVTLCAAHHALGWIKHTGRSLSVRYMMDGFTANWGTFRGPNNSHVAVVPEEEW